MRAFSSALLALAACSASASDDTASTTSDLVTVRQLGELGAPELADASSARFRASLAVLAAAHPTVQTVTRSGAGDFVSYDEHVPGAIYAHVDHEMGETLDALFRWSEKTELAVGELPSTFDAWARTQIPSALLASGKVACDQADAPMIGRACALAQRDKAVATARPATGVDLPALVKAWDQAMKGADGARFVAPVVLEGEASVTQIKALAGVSPSCRQRAWGREAVDAFVRQHAELASFAPSLSGPGIAKRWYWACGSDSWGEDGFAVLDEHDQLWAFTTYASE